ncbi:kinase-like domain-containing protein, partial [Dunaliella salina]
MRSRTKGRQQVAIKLPTGYVTPEMAEVFKEETRRTIAQSRNCPHVVECFGWSEIRGVPCLVMRLYERGSLWNLIDEQVGDSIAVPTVLQIARDIAQGLAELHNQRILFNDLKPGNVLLTNDGSCRLADFGLAKVLDHASWANTRTRRGTPYFMPPETFQSNSEGFTVSFASDIWSWGITLTQVVSSDVCAPYGPGLSDGNLFNLLIVQKREPQVPPTPGAPVLQQIIRDCLKLDPAQRPSASVLVQNFKQCLAFMFAPLRVTLTGLDGTNYRIPSITGAVPQSRFSSRNAFRVATRASAFRASTHGCAFRAATRCKCFQGGYP